MSFVDAAPAPLQRTTAAPWLRADGFTATRGDRQLFEAIGFSLERGRALLLRGPNGSGKSTLLRSLVGLAVLDSGRLQVDGQAFDAASRKLCPFALFQGHASGLKAELSAARCLRFSAELDGSPHDDTAVHEALERMGLARQAGIDVRRLSQGQKQRLTLCRLVIAGMADGSRHSASRVLWLLDEPSAALDQAGARLLDELLAGHLGDGGAAIIATHLPLPGIAARADVLSLEATG